MTECEDIKKHILMMCDHKAGYGLAHPDCQHKEDFTCRVECFSVFHSSGTILPFPFLYFVFLAELQALLCYSIQPQHTYQKFSPESSSAEQKPHVILQINTPANSHSILNEERLSPAQEFLVTLMITPQTTPIFC